MTRTFALSASLVALGLLFAPAAQAEDTMVKKDSMEHMSKPMHKNMKKGTMHKDTMMKGDAMKGDAMQK